MARSSTGAPPVRLYRKPDELLALPPGASAVIEASAGTGKTYLLEHLVLDRLIESDIGLENILIVTFTEKATAELNRRLRAAIDRLLAAANGPPSTDPAGPPEASWRLDETAQRRLLRARQSFDRATIATMHGFCQGVLTENAFISNRLFTQQHVDSRQVFATVFTSVLRRTLSTDPALRPYLTAWLRFGRSVDDLEQLLYDVRRMASPFGVRFEPQRIREAAAAFAAAASDPAAEAAVTTLVGNKQTSKALMSRLRTLLALCQSLGADGDLPRFLQLLDESMRGTGDLFTYVEDRLAGRPMPAKGPMGPLHAAFLALADAAVPLDVAVATLFAPVVNRQLEDHKRQAGLFDFDDMLALVADALDGPHGEALIQTLRDRYKVAFIDEFQDTDPIQWRIFQRVFFDSGGSNPLTIIGDPKQSIYGFRGADVQTYLAARTTVSGVDGPAVRLVRNFRSVPAVIDAYNAILDQEADTPFFSGAIGYDRPAIAGRDPEPDGADDGPAVTLLSVTPTTPDPLVARDVKRTLSERIATEIKQLLAGPTPVPAGEIFVLTRTVAEADAVGQVLREAGVPHAFFKQDGLYQTPEARHVRDLLAAIDDPTDRSQRAKAWLTPFFGLTLDDLPACAGLTPDHPLYARFFTWRALADDEDFPRLFERILDDSGVVRRELFGGTSRRRLTNYVHLFELLLAQTARARPTLSELVRNLGAYIDRLRAPSVEEGNIQRREGDRDAVLIMTMHKAKGLEADVVFLYGGFTAWRGTRRIRTYSDDGQRLTYVGRPRRLHVEQRIKEEQAEEDQRLLYVAMTRARRRLYLPYFGLLGEGDELWEVKKEEEVWKKLYGGYRHVNRRLRAVLAAASPEFGGGGDGDRHPLFSLSRVPCPPEPAPPDPALRSLAARLGDWHPPPQLLADPAAAHSDALAGLRQRHAGLVITSYSRIKRAHGGYQPPAAVVDAIDAAIDAPLADGGAAAPPEGSDPDQLPGGALSGIFLHAVLESVPLETLAAASTEADWAALPAIRELFALTMRRTDRDPRFLADAQRLIYRALTTPIALSATRTLPGIARAQAVLRETEFVYPVDAGARAFIKGFIDLIFEDQGRVYVADWKSDFLPSWEAEAVAAHVATNYGLQARLYALAMVKMLGIADQQQYDARFGGMVFIFLRGLPEGLQVQRPSYAEILGWQRELSEQPL